MLSIESAVEGAAIEASDRDMIVISSLEKEVILLDFC